MREKLKSYIIDRVKNITNDCRTFLWYKSVHNIEYKSIKADMGVGGGNLLMSVGLFVSLEYLSKIYYVLKYGVDNIKVKNNNDIDWRDPFYNLIKDTPVDLGIKELSDHELEVFFKNWRHKLAHYLAQDVKWGTVNAFDRSSCDYCKAVEEILQKVSFYNINGRWICEIEKFTIDIEKISEWVADYVDRQADSRIESSLRWLEKQWD